jgi:hypothetical protein
MNFSYLGLSTPEIFPDQYLEESLKHETNRTFII